MAVSETLVFDVNETLLDLSALDPLNALAETPGCATGSLNK